MPSAPMLSALGLARSIESGELTPAQALDLCADAIAERESEVGAFVTLDIEGARKAAEQPGRKNAPLRGLAVALKDIFDTADMPTEYGSPIYTGYRPKVDCSLVAMIRRAGGTLIGKTITTEFAMSIRARPRTRTTSRTRRAARRRVRRRASPRASSRSRPAPRPAAP